MGGSENRSLPSTLWTIVLKARDPSSADRREALEHLIQAYWKPVYYFIRRRGNDVETSKDVTQGFFSALIEKNTLQYLRPREGKFRSFLLRAVQNYLGDEYDRAKALRRGGGKSVLSLDFAQAEAEAPRDSASEGASDRAFCRDWAVRVMAQAMQILENESAASGRRAEFEAFKLYLNQVRPEGASYAELGKALELSEDEVRSRVRTARGRYREAILEVIRSYTDGEETAQEELRDLLSAFS